MKVKEALEMLEPFPYDYLTAKEVAHILGVAPTTVSRWGRTGKLRAHPTPGGRRVYLKRDILQALADS